MSKIIGYSRVSTITQTNENQRLSILDYCHKNGLVAGEIIEVVTTSKLKRYDRQIDTTLEKLEKGDTLIVHALDRLGRSTLETLQIIDDIKNKGIRLIIIKENIIVDTENNNPLNSMLLAMLSAVAELERNFISERTKLGLARVKANGTILGRKKGVQGKSKYDPFKEKIIEYRKLGLSLKNIVKAIGVGTNASLLNYINSRGLKKEIEKVV